MAALWSTLLAAPVAVGVYRPDGGILLANQALLDLVGHPIETVREHGWISTLCPDPREQELVRARAASLLASEGTTRLRRPVTFADGLARIVEVTTSAVELPDGTRALMSSVVDLTGFRMPPSTRERSYQDLLEDSPDLFGRFEAGTGRVLYLSRVVERFTGLCPDAFYRDPDLFLAQLAPDSRSAWQGALLSASQGETRVFDVVLESPWGGRTILRQTLNPIREPGGRVEVVEGIAHDITLLRQGEELRARRDARASLDALKSQLFANVSHELRTPLVSIKGYNDLLLRGALGPLTPRQRRGLEIASANTERLIELIESLLDFARREEGRLELQPERIDLREPVREAAAALADRIASRKLRLRMELGEQPLWVLGDPARLQQVFRALLANAEKFTEGAGDEIVIVARGEPDAIAVSVADRGIGIPEHAKTRIFDRFYQVDASPTRRFGGAGLGLALAKELAALHQGTIEVDSVEGGGSTFTVRLPRADDAPEGRSDPRPLVLVGIEEVAAAGLRGTLERASSGPMDLLFAASVDEVLRRARRHRPDLLLIAFSSVQLLGQALDRLRREGEMDSAPLVVVGPNLPELAERADCLVAPGDALRLAEGISRLLGREAARRVRAPKVAVVEDEPEILDFTKFILEREGYEVLSLTSGEAALEAIESDCDLVILDIALEGIDGIELCRRLKSDPTRAQVPVLMVTAMGGEAVRQSSLGAGAEGYLLKPFGVDEFLRQVQLHLRARDGLAPKSA